MVGFQPLNHNKQTCKKILPNHNHGWVGLQRLPFLGSAHRQRQPCWALCTKPCDYGSKMRTRNGKTKPFGPYPGGLILTHTHTYIQIIFVIFILACIGPFTSWFVESEETFRSSLCRSSRPAADKIRLQGAVHQLHSVEEALLRQRCLGAPRSVSRRA